MAASQTSTGCLRPAGGARSAMVAGEAKLVEGGGELVVVWAGLAFILLASSALAALKDATCLLELAKRLHGQSRETVVLRSDVVGLMDWDSGVNDL